jgi:hypothetical protein
MTTIVTALLLLDSWLLGAALRTDRPFAVCCFAQAFLVASLVLWAEVREGENAAGFGYQPDRGRP